MTLYFDEPTPIVSEASAMELTRLLQRVATAANEATSIPQGIQAGIDAICDYTGWEVGHGYLFDKTSQRLTSLPCWRMSDPTQFAAFREQSDALTFTPGVDFIGEVFADTTPMWILDVTESSVFRRKETAHAAGLKAAFAFPIFIGKKAVAVIEFYSLQSVIPEGHLLSAMANIGKQLGQVIERCQFMERATLLQTVIASANDGIIITRADLDGENSPEIIYVNEAFTRITGYSREEAIGRTPRFLQGDFTSRDTLDTLRKTLEAGQPFKGELVNYHKNGQYYWLDISIVPVRDAEGNITHYAAIERDITDRKQQETKYQETLVQLKRASLKAEAASRDLQESLAKAEEANRAKSNFLANMSHELRTPMNGVLGMAHLLADTPMTQEQLEYVSTINGSAETLLMLLNDILDFSKIEAGALELENIPFAPAQVLHETISLLRPQAEKKGIRLLVECDAELPAYLWGDPGRMRQILTNLIGNALKFTEQGYVRLSVKTAQSTFPLPLGERVNGERVSASQKGEGIFQRSLTPHPDSQTLSAFAGESCPPPQGGRESGRSFAESLTPTTLSFSIEDTGIGIPAEKVGTIFDKFTQADTSVTRKYGGTGLGLAITRNLVQLMGGTIGVESAQGKGSTFWFRLPCNEASTQDYRSLNRKEMIISDSLIERRPIGAVRALLVEDTPVNQIFAQKLLRKFGFAQIDLAENGLEALEKYRETEYDVIFMDCQMPELDGYETTTRIRALEENTPLHTPVVAMTANAMIGDREKCLKSGMDDYVSKPLQPDHLQLVLQKWFLLETPAAASRPALELVQPAPSESESQPPVDLEQLRMFTDGDPEEEKALIELFLEQATELLGGLSGSLAQNDNAAWKATAHRFKGASGNFGAMQLHHLCKRAEMEADDPTSQKNEMLAALMQETTRVQQFLKAG